jgi:putative endopeptidase
MMIPIKLFAGALASMLSLSAVWAQSTSKPQYGTWGIDLEALDPGVRPGNDFNQYANGKWLARTQIPSDQSMASLRLLMTDLTASRLHTRLEKAAADSLGQPTTLDGKVGAFYKSFMDSDRVDKLGAGPIQAELTAVRDTGNRSQLAGLMGRTQVGFEGSIFGMTTDVDLKNVSRYALYLRQSGLGLPDRDYYLKPEFAAQKSAYQAYVAQLLTLVNWPDANNKAADVVAFEARIAKVSWSKSEQRDLDKIYNVLTLRQLYELTPGFAWTPFLKSAGLDHLERVIVAEKSAFLPIATVYQTTPLDVLKAWEAFTITDNTAFYLSRPFAQARFEFRDKMLSGQPERPVRWKEAIHAVGGGDCTNDRVDCFGNMGFGVGQLYTATYFPPASKAKIEALVANVKAAMRARLEGLTWMGSATKIQALKKLDTYQIKVGYPDHPRDYSGLEIKSDDLVGNVRRAGAWDWNFYLSRLNGPVDRSDWTMTPQTNDAYNGSLRDIVFPAGILQPPIFDAAADPAVNYGAIGAVIGHELTHGFDDQGRKLDADGNLRDWWTAADAAAFEALAKRLGAQYSAYEVFPGVHINGNLTMGENIADLGGLTVALDAYHRSLQGATAPVLDSFSGDQRVFLGWAQAWRGKYRDDFVREMVVSDPHSPRAFRIDGPTRNISAWYAAFAVKEGDSFYLKPEERVSIW